jgi:hypothetical protein
MKLSLKIAASIPRCSISSAITCVSCSTCSLSDRVFNKPGHSVFVEHRPLEEQVEQLTQVIAELIEHLGIDAAIFNDNFIKVE